MQRWTPQRALNRTVEVLRQEGIGSLWFKVLGETVYRRMVLMERRFDETEIDIPPRLPVSHVLLHESEVEEYCAFRPGAGPGDIRRRLQDGQQCFVVRYQGRMAHACWTVTGRAWIPYLSRELRLAPDAVYSYEAYTAPEYRGQNLSPARQNQMMGYYRKAGFRRVIAVIVPENKAAFRPNQKTGWRPLGMLGTVKVGPWRYDFCRLFDAGMLPGQVPTDRNPDYWDDVGQQFGQATHYLDPFLGQMKRQAYLDLIGRWGGVPAKGCVLKTDLFEEAMGSDAFLTDLAQGDGSVVGIDLSPAIAQRAQRQDGERLAAYMAADVRHLPFAGDTFELVLSPSTLDHFADPSDLGRSLKEVDRVLKPHGRLIVTLDNRQNITDPLLRLVGRLGWVPYFLGRSYTVDELRAELEATGFEVEDTTAILHNPRLAAVAAVSMANRLRWRPVTTFVRRLLLAAQHLADTQWCYRSGSFVAAKAVCRKTGGSPVASHPPAPDSCEHGQPT